MNMKIIWIAVWSFTCIYGFIASIGNGCFSLGTLMFISGFMLARNYSDVLKE